MIYIYIISIFFFSCAIEPPDLEWEDVTSDHESTLNIIGLLSTDSLRTSFVKVQRTLDMEEASDSLIRDTIGSSIYIYYTSRFIVRNANVVVSNGVKDYILDYTDFIYDVDMDKALQEVYIYNGNDLNPQPGERWTLHVSAPGGFEATGQTIIPPAPKIFTENLPDTFQVFSEMGMSWLTMDDNYQLINSAHLGPWDSYLCGINQEYIISPEESSATFRREWCDSELDDPSWDNYLLFFSLMSMDNNYYDYFIRYSDAEFTSSFGSGGSGRNFGINGGIGVFGSIAIDRHSMIMTP
ncbi:MAG: hypothetical protein P8L91_01645 [Candidatus Marinimicrobia bacterium]|nr:hypothetical protein [Candidatus Neomarinimicrobiota bacterium]